MKITQRILGRTKVNHLNASKTYHKYVNMHNISYFHVHQSPKQEESPQTSFQLSDSSIKKFSDPKNESVSGTISYVTYFNLSAA
jgi:hypothetical protein